MVTIQGLKKFLFFTQTSKLTKLRKHENAKLWPKNANRVRPMLFKNFCEAEVVDCFWLDIIWV
jgi:hypothetical protein